MSSADRRQESTTEDIFFADYVSDRLWSLQIDALGARDLIEHTAELAIGGGSVAPLNAIASFAEDSTGNLYVVSLDGRIYRLEAREALDNGPKGPVVKIQRPRDDSKFNRNRITVSGVVRRLEGNGIDRVIVTVQGRGPAKVIDDQTQWRTKAGLRRGINRISAIAVDGAGRRSNRDLIRVTRR